MRAYPLMIVAALVSVLSLSCKADFGPAPSVPIASLSIEPANPVIQVGTWTQLSAVARDSAGGTLTDRPTKWTSSTSRIAIVGPSGIVTAVSPGSAAIFATAEGKLDMASVTVTSTAPPTLAAVVLSPASLVLSTGAIQQFAASGAMSDGSTSAVTVSYSATGGSITAGGLYTAGSLAGTYRVIATQSGGTLADTSQVTITPPSPTQPTLVAVVLTPASITLQTGAIQQFVGSGLMSDGSTTGVNVTYSATGGNVSSNGLYAAGTVAGSYWIVAAQTGGTLADTSVVTIISPPPAPPTLAAVVLSPPSIVLQSGATQQFAVSGLMTDGSTSAVNVTYSATGGSVTSGGLYTAGSVAGTYRVIATQSGGTLADSSAVTITAPNPVPPSLVAVVMTPASIPLQSGATQQFAVSGLMSDGSTAAVNVTYNATGGTVTSGGLYTAGSVAGSYRVIATQTGGTLADTSAVTITLPPPTLVAVVMTPPSIALQGGATQQFAVSGRMSDGSTAAVNVTYNATGGSITSGGLYTAGGVAGSYRVIATQTGGTLADTSAVTITLPPPTLVAVILTPPSITLASGATQQFAVSGLLSNGSTTTISVTYSGTGGTITSGGLYTAGSAAGSYRVIATQTGGTLADTSAVTVTVPGTPPLWTADQEAGNLLQWESNPYGGGTCGGQFNNGDATTVASRDFARTGLWSVKLSIAGNNPAANGARLIRWCESQRNRELFYSVWYYIPQRLTISGWMTAFFWKARPTPSASPDPIFYLDVRNAPNGAMRFMLSWWNGLSIEGPAPGQFGYRTWTSTQEIPVGRWFQVQARYVCDGNFGGAIQVWQDDVEIFKLEGVRTRYPTGDCEWGISNYGTGITPSPVILYIDDAAISTSKIGP